MEAAAEPAARLDLAPPLLAFLDALLRREWLVTNGRGGYASGTVAGANTRRYHGLLVAALQPPVGRTVLLAKVDETLELGGRTFELGTNEYHDGTIAPEGYRHLAGFRLEGTLPVWTYALPGAQVEKRVWMPSGRDAVCVRYRVLGAVGPARLRLRPFLTERDYHSHTRGDPSWRFDVGEIPGGVRVVPWRGAAPYTLTVDCAAFVPAPDWYWRFLHRAERERGLDDEEDLYVPGEFQAVLEPGEALTLVSAAGDSPPPAEPDSLAAEAERQRRLLQLGERLAQDSVSLPGSGGLPPRLLLAADQFLVRCAARQSVIAGYHWFSDWGRDTMIALPGLTLATGRLDEARDILLSYADHVSEGMLPNRFPDDGGAPEYTSADAALWYVHAVGRYLARTGDRDLLARLFPAVREIVDRYRTGTRHGIRADPADGLLETGGAPDLALTWMDARRDGRPVTPRTGKAVDLNALWHEALCLVAAWSKALGWDGSADAEHAATLRRAFTPRFFHAAGGYLYDVIRPDGSPDASLRPNQLLALSLPHALVEGPAARTVFATVTTRLLTPFGLRTLAADAPEYHGRYEGDVPARDGAYHQGTVWAWWLAPYAAALLRLTGNRRAAYRLLEPFRAHLLEVGLGTVSELFDGDSPFDARGCIAQAWSVAALLDVWQMAGEAP